MTKTITQTKMMIERDNNYVNEITVEGWVHFSNDYSYGENADHRYGESRCFVEDVTEIFAWDAFGKNFKLTPDEIDDAKAVLGQKFLED